MAPILICSNVMEPDFASKLGDIMFLAVLTSKLYHSAARYVDLSTFVQIHFMIPLWTVRQCKQQDT